jgi:hypothetical protein
MKAARYVKWADGFAGKIPADKAYAALEKIRAANGGELTAVSVVEASRAKSSALHPMIFDRSVKAAADEYYKANARKVIASVIVTFGEKPRTPTRAYAVVREEQSPVSPSRSSKFYGSIEEALQNPEHRQYVLAAALREAAQWRKRYAALSELATIFRAIDRTAKKVL